MAAQIDDRVERGVAYLRRAHARHGTPAEKFWARVDPVDGCWLWAGGKNAWGYGVVSIAGRPQAAHRLSWEIHNGPIPAGLFVCHDCDVRDCVNPAHLWLGTAQENVADMDRKGRRGRGWHPVRIGEAHAASRLSDVKVAAIRADIDAGETHRSIARKHGISHTYVGKLARRVSRAQ